MSPSILSFTTEPHRNYRSQWRVKTAAMCEDVDLFRGLPTFYRSPERSNTYSFLHADMQHYYYCTPGKLVPWKRGLLTLPTSLVITVKSVA